LKKTNFKRAFTSILAIVLVLVTGIIPTLAVSIDPYIGMEYDYSEEGTIDLFVGTLDNGEAYYYGGSDYYPYNYCHYYRINDKTAYCCWSNMNAPSEQYSNRTKYYIGNNAARAKAMYYFNWANPATPTGRNEKIASGMPASFLGKDITYYKDYVQAITDYAMEYSLDGEVDYSDYNDDIMGYLIGHLTMDDMMNAGDGIHVSGVYLDPDSPIVKGVYKLVDEILYNDSVMAKVPAVPSSARVFYCFPDRESGRDIYSQGLMSIEAAPTGGFEIDKRSSNAEMTDKNACYSFKDAEFEVYTNSNATDKIKTLVTDKNGYADIDGLKPGTYYFKETKAPKGYKLNPDIFKVTVKAGDKPKDNVVKVYDEPGNDPASLVIFKNDPDHIEKDENGKEVKKGLAGVEFELSYYDADPETTKSLADLGNKTPTRTWKLKTDSDGYARIANDWKIGGDDFYYSAYGDKGQPLGTPSVPIGCLTLQETKAADGYIIDNTVRFARVTESMAENHEMIKFSGTDLVNDSVDYPNRQTETVISKKSITTQEELPGASLEVKDKGGKVVDEWVSTDEAHTIRGLKPGETYTLIETISPDGFVISTDIEFTVNSDGSVTHVEMVDDTTKFEFVKVDEEGNPVEGAVLRIEVFKENSNSTPDEASASENGKWEPVPDEEWTTDKEGTPHKVEGKLAVGKRYRLVEVKAPKGFNIAAPIEFTVENTTEPVAVKMVDTTTRVSKTDITGEKEIPGAKLIVRDKDGNIVDEWTSTEDIHFADNLIEGETYTLEESIPAPGYVTAEPITFTVTKDGISTDVTMKDEPTKVVIRKVDEDNKPLSGAKLQILDKDNNVIDEWTTDGKDHLIEAKLIVGETYTLHEVTAPDGYEVAEDISFTVKDTAEEQVVSMTDAFKSNTKISTPDQPTKSSSNQGGGAVVQTGQGTIGLMIALAVIMISVACFVFYRKKKENNT
jgi:uncharacterized surface anchored protein